MHVTPSAGTVTDQLRATVTVDWKHAPAGTTTVPVTVTGTGTSVVVQAPVSKPTLAPAGFLEAGGYVAMEADHYTSKAGDWRLLPGLGRTGNGLEATGGGAELGYTMTLTTPGPIKVTAYLSPRIDTQPTGGLKYAVSIDGETPQVVNTTTATGADDLTMNPQWARNTSDNVNVTTTVHTVAAPGRHTLRFWAVDPTVIVQRLVVQTAPLPYSYLGPPESRHA